MRMLVRTSRVFAETVTYAHRPTLFPAITPNAVHVSYHPSWDDDTVSRLCLACIYI